MTIILKCDQCKTNEINLRAKKIYHIKELTERTGWTHEAGGLHICDKCHKFITDYEALKNDAIDDKDTYAIMGSEPEGTKLVRWKVWECRYTGNLDRIKGNICKHLLNHVDKKHVKRRLNELAKLKYHEETRHPHIYKPIGSGNKRIYTYRSKKV